MKTPKDYLFNIPVWMREDKDFSFVFSEISKIYIDIQQTKEDIINSFSLDNLAKYDSSLETIASYFGINRNHYLPMGNRVVSVNMHNGSYEYEENVPINIRLTNETMLRMLKFKLLKSNFDGTRKNLLDNYSSLFRGDRNVIQFLEGILVNDTTGAVLPMLNLNMTLNDDSQSFLDEATLFLNGAYQFNYLGVVTRYSLGGQTIELIWDKSKWDKAKYEV